MLTQFPAWAQALFRQLTVRLGIETQVSRLPLPLPPQVILGYPPSIDHEV